MRPVANYSMSVVPPDALGLHRKVEAAIADWLTAKGIIDLERPERFNLRDGRTAELQRRQFRTGAGELLEMSLTEPTDAGIFQTYLVAGRRDAAVGVSCSLRAGTLSGEVVPTRFEVRCPAVLRAIIELQDGWTYGASPLRTSPLRLTDSDGARQFVELAWSKERALPIVAISEDHGVFLHPGIDRALALDLAGLATVVVLESTASWELTRTRGKAWSCFGGAVRVFWPDLHSSTDPYRHPLWTPRRLLENVVDSADAAERIRRQLRRLVFSQSALSVREPALFSALRRSVRDDELAASRDAASRVQDAGNTIEAQLQVIVALYEEIDRKDDRIEELEQDLADLRAQNANLQESIRRWSEPASDEVPPEDEIPPATVEDAVLLAMDKYDDTLRFGGDVNAGIRSLAPDAGPPDKILRYLGKLSDLTVLLRSGKVGRNTLDWLAGQGVSASRESETIRNSKSEMQRRIWDDGTGQGRQFELHLKPVEATHPDKCVRIYFEYDRASCVTVIGWVGRHP